MRRRGNIFSYPYAVEITGSILKIPQNFKSWGGVPKNRNLALAPLSFTFGFFKISWRHNTMVWRILGYMPNLSVGVDKNMSADEKQVEHPCLSEILRNFEAICNSGGFKTCIAGRLVVLKLFI